MVLLKLVNCMVCELHLDKVVKKSRDQRSANLAHKDGVRDIHDQGIIGLRF